MLSEIEEQTTVTVHIPSVLHLTILNDHLASQFDIRTKLNVALKTLG